jgi:hypothetical protein
VLADVGLEVTAVEELASGPSKAATTPTMDRATMSPPTIHSQIGTRLFGGDTSLGVFPFGRASTSVTEGRGTPTGWRLAVHARPFQYRLNSGSFWSGYQPGSRDSPDTSPQSVDPWPEGPTHIVAQIWSAGEQ